ncbi:TPA: hypothetical protein QCQ12_003093 [Bacillus cereus biovar anthracis]|nr:hypothetical protein [Bacillus cereus biovar anthracis]
MTIKEWESMYKKLAKLLVDEHITIQEHAVMIKWLGSEAQDIISKEMAKLMPK